jgi:anti-anti-sigma factor
MNEEAAMQPTVVDRGRMLKEPTAWGEYVWLTRPSLGRYERLRAGRGRLFAGTKYVFHQHPGSDELLYVLSGTASLWIERHKQTLKPGDLAFIPEGTAHALFNDSEQDCEFLSMFAPGMVSGDFTVDVSRDEPYRSITQAQGIRDFELERLPGRTIVARITTEAIWDPFAIEQFRTGLQRILETEKPQRLVLDFEAVTGVSSGVLGVLAQYHRAMRTDGRSLRLFHLMGNVQEIFNIAQMGKLLAIYPTREAALAAAD